MADMLWKFAVMVLATTANMLVPYLREHAMNRSIAYTVNRALDQGVVGLFGLVVAPMMLSSFRRGGFDVDTSPSLSGPMEDDEVLNDDAATDEEVEDNAPIDPYRMGFATSDLSLSSTLATFGQMCHEGAFPRKEGRRGFQFAKTSQDGADEHMRSSVDTGPAISVHTEYLFLLKEKGKLGDDVEGEGDPAAPPVDSEAPSSGVPIHAIISDGNGRTLEELHFFDTAGRLVEFTVYGGDDEVLEVAGLDVVGEEMIDVIVIDEDENTIEFTLLVGLGERMVEITVGGMDGKRLEVVVFDMDDIMVAGAGWTFRPDTETEEMAPEEVHVSKVPPRDDSGALVLSAPPVKVCTATMLPPHAEPGGLGPWPPLHDIVPSEYGKVATDDSRLYRSTSVPVPSETRSGLRYMLDAILSAFARAMDAVGRTVSAADLPHRTPEASGLPTDAAAQTIGSDTPALDGLITENTWSAVIFLGKLVDANTRPALLVLAKLAGSFWLAVTDSAVLAGGCLILAATVLTWIVLADELALEAGQQPTFVSMAVHAQSPAPIRGDFAAGNTKSTRKARRKANIAKRRERGVGLHISAMRC